MKTIEKQNLKIPIEIFLDVCKMIGAGGLINKINGSSDVTGEVYLELKCQKGNKVQEAALHNIYESINEWNQQRYGNESPDELLLN